MKLLILGSCRIHDTLGSVKLRNGFKILNHTDPKWFMHNVRAAEEALKIITGELNPPLHLKDLIFETDDEREIKYKDPCVVKEADVLVLEMCILKSARLAGWDLNLHRIFREEKKTGSKINGVTVSYFDANEVVKCIDRIKESTGKPVLIVNHIQPTGIGEMDLARRKVTELIKSAQKVSNFYFFDTASVMANVETHVALMDHSHYQNEFKPVMGNALADHIAKCLYR